MSIATWKTSLTAEGDFCITLEYPNTDEMYQFCFMVETTLHAFCSEKGIRRGYELNCYGSANKAVQGINWHVTLVFDDGKSSEPEYTVILRLLVDWSINREQ